MPKTPVIKIKTYQDDAGEFRWRARARNGKIVAESGEGYKRESAALTAASKLADADIVVVE